MKNSKTWTIQILRKRGSIVLNCFPETRKACRQCICGAWERNVFRFEHQHGLPVLIQEKGRRAQLLYRKDVALEMVRNSVRRVTFMAEDRKHPREAAP
jgi:hypothetical protein